MIDCDDKLYQLIKYQMKISVLIILYTKFLSNSNDIQRVFDNFYGGDGVIGDYTKIILSNLP